MVASETQVLEDSNGSTHIYCNSLEVNGDLISNTNARGLDRESNKHIHVDGLSPSASNDADGRRNLISRMSSIGRSLIHVDFLTWRKKKKYSRRNSLGNEKDCFQNMVIEDYCGKNILPSSGHLAVLANNPFTFKSADKVNSGVSPEENNNKSNAELNALMGRIPKENQLDKKDDNESFASDEKSLSVSSTPTIVQGKCKQNSITKLHSHLPISTFSAAMNVAVEMRYDENCQKNDLQPSNISNFSHSTSNEDQSPRTNPKIIYNTNLLKTDQLQDCGKIKHRLQGKCRQRKNEMAKDEIKKNKISEASSSTSLRSTNITTKDSSYSTKFVALLISSDESDDDFTHITQATKMHSSSTSLNTQSNESLNSLLSETGELNSSTNTLCSVVNEYVNNPIAPMPMTLSATPEENINKEPVLPQSDSKEKSNKLSSNICSGCKNSTGPKTVKSEQKSVQGTFTLPEQSNKCQRINTSIIQSSTNGIKDFSRKETNNIKRTKTLNELADNLPELNEEPILINEKPMLTPQPARNCNLKSSNSKMGSEVPSSIPQKYRHQITVTPIKREKWKENNHNKQLDFDNNYTNPQRSLRDLGVRHGSINKGNYREMNAERQAFPELTIKGKSAARVAFDLDGKVIYSRSSSARKNRQVKTNETVHNATNKLESSQDTNHSQINELIVGIRNNCNHKDIDKVYRLDLSNHYNQRNLSQNSSLLLNNTNNLDYSLGQTHGNEFQTICDFPKLENSSNLKMETFKPIISTTKSNEVVGKSFDTFLLPTPTRSLPDPNISGLPKNKNMLQSANIQHEFKAEKVNYFSSKESEDAQTVTNFSPSVKLSSKENEHIKSPVSTLSSEDLFALIYEYKKKLNIKTNLDISKPLSRSSSPFCYRPNSSKGVLAETGFISTQNPTQLQISGNRKSWADFRPVDNQISTRKSLASDRLGPPKPTSLHDFKMLLLQTRNHMISEPHKSAVELLKHPSPQNSQEFIKPSRPMSVRNSISFPVSRAAKEAINDGHSTVPFKRGSKARISLQAQYYLYPPIFEDHLEDIEVSSDKENIINGEQASETKSTFNEWRAS